jgi:hypothetical protein
LDGGHATRLGDHLLDRRLVRLVFLQNACLPACCISFIQMSIKRSQQGKAKAHLLLLIDTLNICSN